MSEAHQDHEHAGDEEVEEFEVVELESDHGETEEFIIIDRIDIEEKVYAVMALLQDVRDMETLTPDEFREIHGEESIFVLMRQEDDAYFEMDEEEYEQIKDKVEAYLAENQ